MEWLVIKPFNLKLKPAIGGNNILNQFQNRMVIDKPQVWEDWKKWLFWLATSWKEDLEDAYVFEAQG